MMFIMAERQLRFSQGLVFKDKAVFKADGAIAKGHKPTVKEQNVLGE